VTDHYKNSSKPIWNKEMKVIRQNVNRNNHFYTYLKDLSGGLEEGNEILKGKTCLKNNVGKLKLL
jgi:hypothetical protein